MVNFSCVYFREPLGPFWTTSYTQVGRPRKDGETVGHRPVNVPDGESPVDCHLHQLVDGTFSGSSTVRTSVLQIIPPVHEPLRCRPISHSFLSYILIVLPFR